MSWVQIPSLTPSNLLNPLPRQLRVGRIWAQNLGYFLHRVALGLANNVTVDSQRNARVRVTKLRLCDRGRRSHLQQQAGMGVPKCVHAATRNPQLIENRPQLPLHDIVCTVGLAATVAE